MRKFLLTTVLLGLATCSGQAAIITVSGTDGVDWPANDGSIVSLATLNFQLSENSGAFNSTSFNLTLGAYTSGGNYVAIGSLDSSIGVTWTPEPAAGATVDGSNNTPHPGVPGDQFSIFQNASAYFSGDGYGGLTGTYGTGNYIGFSLVDSNSQTHYGWMNFELGTPSFSSPAVTFLNGYINDTPNAAVTVGQPALPVPEPSAFALIGGALALAPLSRRFRRSSKA